MKKKIIQPESVGISDSGCLCLQCSEKDIKNRKYYIPAQTSFA